MKPFRNALIEFYPEMKRLDARHKWVEKFVTGNRSVEHHCYVCSKCGKKARLTQLTMYGSVRITRKRFLPKLREQVYESTPLLNLMLGKKVPKKLAAVFSNGDRINISGVRGVAGVNGRWRVGKVQRRVLKKTSGGVT